MRPLCRERPTHPVQPHLLFPRWMDVARAFVCQRRRPVRVVVAFHGFGRPMEEMGNYLPFVPRRHGDAFGGHCPPKRQHSPAFRDTPPVLEPTQECFKPSMGWLDELGLSAPAQAPAGVFARGANLARVVRARSRGMVGHGSLGPRWLQEKRDVPVCRGNGVGTGMLGLRGSSRRSRSKLHPRPATRTDHPGPPRTLCPAPHGRPRHAAARGSHLENAPPVLAHAQRGIAKAWKPLPQRDVHVHAVFGDRDAIIPWAWSRPWRHLGGSHVHFLTVSSGHVMRHPETVEAIRRVILGASNET